MKELREQIEFVNIRIRKVFLYLFLIFIACIQMYPLLWLLFFSLKSNKEIFGGNVAGVPQHFVWENYKIALFKGNIGQYLLNSIFVTLATIFITCIISAMAAYAIERMRWKFSRVLLIIILMGLMIPIHATLLPLFMFFARTDLLNSLWCLILPYVGFGMPMSIYILTGFLKSIPKEMEESSFLDGCSIYSTFILIIFPMIKPAVATVSIFIFLASWNELMFATTFISKPEFRTLTVGIQNMVGQYVTQWGPIGAGLVIATVPTVIIYLFLSKQVQRSLIVGAVKE